MNGRRASAILLAAFGLYATAWILRSSVEVGGVRWFCLLDDAMISMRYARHLAEGLGLRFNPGEPPVEGITNLLWTVFMAIPHLLGLRPERTSLFVQVAGALCLGGTALGAGRLARRMGGSSAASAGAVALTAFYGPLDLWSLAGMEVAPLALLTTWALVLGLEDAAASRFRPAPYLLLTVGTLIRLDAAVVMAGTTAALSALSAIGPHRRRHAFWGAGLLLGSLLGQTAFRLAYFGDPVPNTYYLKMEGFPAALRVLHGLSVTLDFALGFGVVLGAIALWPLLPRARSLDRDAAWTAALLVGLQVGYAVWVGGDAWEFLGGANRFVAVAAPLLLTLVAVGLGRAASLLAPRLRLPGPAVLGVLVAVASVRSNAYAGRTSLRSWILLELPYPVTQTGRLLRLASTVAPALDAGATVAVVTAGAIPYLLERRTIDILGKCDRRIARLPMRERPLPRAERFFPGHLKWDYAYSIGELAPDVVFGVWYQPQEAAPYLAAYDAVPMSGTRIWFRRGSPRVHPARLDAHRAPSARP